MRSMPPPINEFPDINTPPFERDNESLNDSFMDTSLLDLCTGCVGIPSQDGFAMYPVKIPVLSSLLHAQGNRSVASYFRVWALVGKDAKREMKTTACTELCGERRAPFRLTTRAIVVQMRESRTIRLRAM